MTHRELERLVALGEGQHLEFKRKVPRPQRLAKEVIAFANGGGGHLLLGVDDDGSIVGVRDADEELYSLQEALNTHCDPPVSIALERVAISRRRDVIVVLVKSSDRKPHYVVHRGSAANRKVAYVRVKDKSVEASREAVRLMKEHPTDNVLFEFGEKEHALMRYLEAYGRITVDQFARLANISRKTASHTLVLLTRPDILRLHPTERQDYFTVAERV
jgi:predicted HTH transcriptional regulator